MINKRRTRRPRRGDGFTLFELIAVIVILAILSGVAIPVMSSMDTQRASMAAKEVLRDVSYVRQRAVASGLTMWIVFDPATETYSVLSEVPANPGLANAVATQDPLTGANFVRQLGQGDFVGVELTSANFDGNQTLGFDWLGRPLNETETDLAATGIIVLTGGHQINITVETGHITHIGP